MEARTPKFLNLRILIAGLLLTGALAGSVVQHVMAVASGAELSFAAQGFDPRGLLTGNYAQVSYAISRPVLENTGLKPAKGWQPVWVAIAPEVNDWKVVSLSAQKPSDLPPGGHLIRADVRYQSQGAVPMLRYGIERIYAQQKEAEAIGRAVTAPPPTQEGAEPVEPNVKIVASLGGDARLRLKAVIVEGKRTDFTWW